MTTPGSAAVPARPVGRGVGERGLIDHIRRRFRRRPRRSSSASATMPPSRHRIAARSQVLTTDALVEGIHFDRRFSTPADIGYKALAVNVSDIAAMGASAAATRCCRSSCRRVFPSPTSMACSTGSSRWRRHNVTLVGGNITRSPGPLIVDVTVIGAVTPRRILTRAAAAPGDHLYVTRHDRRRGCRPWLAAPARRSRRRRCQRIPGWPQCVLRHRTSGATGARSARFWAGRGLRRRAWT